MKTFISFCTADMDAANAFVDELRLFYVDDFFFSPRTLDEGYWLSQIEAEIEAAKWFFVLFSPAAMKSNWVRREVELAMAAPHLKGKVVPILIEETDDWTALHDHVGRLQSLRFYEDRNETLTRVIEGIYKRPRHIHPPYRVGDAMLQVSILAGGNGRTRYRYGDIVCDGPSADTTQRKYQLPPYIAVDAESRLEAIQF